MKHTKEPNPWLVGVAVTCTTCGRRKLPRGRSAPMEVSGCDHECPGYIEAPHAGDLWPGEKRTDFGYPEACPVCSTTLETLRALAGVSDPAKALEAAREALRQAEPFLDEFAAAGNVHVPKTLRKVRAALALLAQEEGT